MNKINLPVIKSKSRYKLILPFDQFLNKAKILKESLSYVRELKVYFPEFNLENGDTVIDVGAHIGSFSVPIAALNEEVKVYCFEPNKRNYEILRRNRDINKLHGQMDINNKAVLHEDGKVVFKRGGTSTTGVVLGINPHVINNGGIKELLADVESPEDAVNCISLERIFSQNKIHVCKLVKMDCEGSEYKIFESVDGKILGQIEYIIVEAHPTEKNKPEDLRLSLLAHGFEVMSISCHNGCYVFYCKRN